MADIKTGPLSRRGFFALVGTAAAALASEMSGINKPKQTETPYDPEKGLLNRSLVRCRNLDTFIEIEQKLNDNALSYHWVEWKNPDLNSKFFKESHLIDYLIKDDPIYLVISNPYKSKAGEDAINAVATTVVFPSYYDGPANPVPQSGIKLVAGGDQDKEPQDFGVFPDIKELNLATAQGLDFVNISHINIQSYKAELGHRLGMDLLNA